MLSDRSKEDLVEIISNCANCLEKYKKSHAIYAGVLRNVSQTILKI